MTPWWVWFAVLALVALLHGAASGIRVAAGRDGRIEHRHVEGRGAGRGMLVVSALLAPFVAAALVDAFTMGRLEVHTQAYQALVWIYGPMAGVTGVAFVLAHTAPWQMRVFVNSVVLGGIEFARPVVAGVGVVVVATITRDVTVTVLCALAVMAGMQVSRVMRQWWYPPLSPVVTRLSSVARERMSSSAREREAR